MNDQKKLVSISQDLKDFLVNINWEEREFMTALSIFETLISHTVLDNDSHIAFVGDIANNAIKAAKVFIDNYKNNLSN